MTDENATGSDASLTSHGGALGPGIRLTLTPTGETNPQAVKMSPSRFRRLVGVTPAEFRAAPRRLTGMTPAEFRAAAALSEEDFEAAVEVGVGNYFRAREVQAQPLEAAE